MRTRPYATDTTALGLSTSPPAVARIVDQISIANRPSSSARGTPSERNDHSTPSMTAMSAVKMACTVVKIP